MKLKQLKEHLETYDKDYVLQNSISKPFSWRGSYGEVAFSIKLEKEQTVKEALENVMLAYTEKFYGYKGGLNFFDDETFVNFEREKSSYSDGGYVQDLIEELDCTDYEDDEQKLTRLAF